MIGYREQLDSLMKLKWPDLSCESVPWALHTPLCNFISCSPVGTPPNQGSSLIELEQVPQPIDVVERFGSSKEEVENAREDGELPSLIPVLSAASDIELTSSKESNLDHFRQLALISKSIVSPIGKAKSQNFKKRDEDSILLLDIESDMDEPAYMEPEEEQVDPVQCFEVDRKWVHYGVREFSLILTRNIGTDKKTVKLEAKVADKVPLVSCLALHQNYTS